MKRNALLKTVMQGWRPSIISEGSKISADGKREIMRSSRPRDQEMDQDDSSFRRAFIPGSRAGLHLVSGRNDPYNRCPDDPRFDR